MICVETQRLEKEKARAWEEGGVQHWGGLEPRPEQHQKVRLREGRTCRHVVKPSPPFTGGETEARELGPRSPSHSRARVAESRDSGLRVRLLSSRDELAVHSEEEREGSWLTRKPLGPRKEMPILRPVQTTSVFPEGWVGGPRRTDCSFLGGDELLSTGQNVWG